MVVIENTGHIHFFTGHKVNPETSSFALSLSTPEKKVEWEESEHRLQSMNTHHCPA